MKYIESNKVRERQGHSNMSVLEIIDDYCPSGFGFSDISENCGFEDDIDCDQCWNREMSEEYIEKDKKYDTYDNQISINVKETVSIDKIAEKVSNKLIKSKVYDTVKVEEDTKHNILKPSHYNSGDFDVIAFCLKNNIDFCRGNIIKYVVRAGKKDPNKEIEDLEKAIEYIERIIEYLRGE